MEDLLVPRWAAAVAGETGRGAVSSSAWLPAPQGPQAHLYMVVNWGGGSWQAVSLEKGSEEGEPQDPEVPSHREPGNGWPRAVSLPRAGWNHVTHPSPRCWVTS